MRNKNAQNNGKDGEYGEGKNEKEKMVEFNPNRNGSFDCLWRRENR